MASFQYYYIYMTSIGQCFLLINNNKNWNWFIILRSTCFFFRWYSLFYKTFFLCVIMIWVFSDFILLALKQFIYNMFVDTKYLNNDLLYKINCYSNFHSFMWNISRQQYQGCTYVFLLCLFFLRKHEIFPNVYLLGAKIWDYIERRCSCLHWNRKAH
jgi:hypothetical protein